MQNNAITTRKLIFVFLLQLEVVIQHVMFIREPHTLIFSFQCTRVLTLLKFEIEFPARQTHIRISSSFDNFPAIDARANDIFARCSSVRVRPAAALFRRRQTFSALLFWRNLALPIRPRIGK
jgi:hypothetical protein